MLSVRSHAFVYFVLKILLLGQFAGTMSFNPDDKSTGFLAGKILPSGTVDPAPSIGSGSDRHPVSSNMQSGLSTGARPRDVKADTPSMMMPGVVGKDAANSDLKMGGIMEGKTHGDIRGNMGMNK